MQRWYIDLIGSERDEEGDWVKFTDAKAAIAAAVSAAIEQCIDICHDSDDSEEAARRIRSATQ